MYRFTAPHYPPARSKKNEKKTRPNSTHQKNYKSAFFSLVILPLSYCKYIFFTDLLHRYNCGHGEWTNVFWHCLDFFFSKFFWPRFRNLCTVGGVYKDERIRKSWKFQHVGLFFILVRFIFGNMCFNDSHGRTPTRRLAFQILTKASLLVRMRPRKKFPNSGTFEIPIWDS